MLPESDSETASIVGYLLRRWQQNAIPDGVTSFDQALYVSSRVDCMKYTLA